MMLDNTSAIILAIYSMASFYLIVELGKAVYIYLKQKALVKRDTLEHIELTFLAITVEVVLLLWLFIHPLYVQGLEYGSLEYAKHLLTHLTKEGFIWEIALLAFLNFKLAKHIGIELNNREGGEDE